MRFDAVAFLESLFRPPPVSSVPDPTPEQLPGDWYKEFAERAAILEYDYGATREYAEAYALREVLKDMRAAGELPG